MVLKDFLVSYLQYHQIWLNALMDDPHLTNITKFKRKKKEKKNTAMYCNTFTIPASSS
jgi:hypothetical protein